MIKLTDILNEIKVEEPYIPSQDFKDTPLNKLRPGKYKMKFTTENRDSWDDMIVEVTQDMINKAINAGDNSYWFWRDQLNHRGFLFGSGDSVLTIYKIK